MSPLLRGGRVGPMWVASVAMIMMSAPRPVAAWCKSAPAPGGWNILNLWSEAIFSIPENLKDRVNVTSEPSSLLAPVCQLEQMVPFGLLHLAHNFNLCEQYVLQLGLKTNLGSNEAGIVACTGGGFCHVRTSPFWNASVWLPDDLPEDDVINIISGGMFEYNGIKPAMIGSIMGNPLQDADWARPWEPWLNEVADSAFRSFLPAGLQATVKENFATAEAFLQFDNSDRLLLPRYPTYLALGVLITLVTEPLVENRTFHYLVAGAMGAGAFLLLALVVVWSFLDRAYKVARQVTPFAEYLVSLSTLVPVVGFFVGSAAFGGGGAGGGAGSGLGNLVAAFLEFVGSFYDEGFERWEATRDLPMGAYAGKAYFGAGALLGVALERTFLVFLLPPYAYRESGASVVRCGQLYLDRLLSLCGVYCFLHSSSSREFAFLTAFLSLRRVRGSIRHMVWTLYLAEHRSPYVANGGRLQSVDEYERNKVSTTQRELDKLRAHLDGQFRQQQVRGRSAVGRINFGDQTRARLEQFRQGGGHVPLSPDDYDDAFDRDGRRFRGAWGRLTQAALTALIVAGVAAAVAHNYLGLGDR